MVLITVNNFLEWLIIVLIFMKTPYTWAARIGLFPSSGCYSHDITMRTAGEVFQGHDVAWVQTRTFDFGQRAPTLPSDWQQMIFNQVTDDSTAVMHYAKSVIWETVVPLDARRLWDVRSQLAVFSIIRVQYQACLATLRSANFTSFLRQYRNLDLVVVDNMLQECMIATSSLFNATVSVYFSNWPISDNYIEFLNVPGLPSAVAKIGSGLPTQMNFSQRITNMLVQMSYSSSKVMMIALVNMVHSLAGYKSDLQATESRQLFYGTPSEFIVNSIRPISNQVKFFGCRHCRLSRRLNVTRKSSEKRNRLQLHPSTWASLENHGINRHLLHQPFIIVTFGSVTSTEIMGARLLNEFMRAFGALNHTVLWHFDGKPPAGQNLPDNVHLFAWLPLKELFEHPNMRLLVCHGGLTTLMEAVHQAIPILGVPFQGDQPSNLRRLQELGISEVVPTDELSTEILLAALNKIIVNFDAYESRAVKIAAMLRHYQDFAGDRQEFWLQWALRNGPAVRNRNYFSSQYRFAWTYYQMPEMICLFVIVSLAWLFIGIDDESNLCSHLFVSISFDRIPRYSSRLEF